MLACLAWGSVGGQGDSAGSALARLGGRSADGDVHDPAVATLRRVFERPKESFGYALVVPVSEGGRSVLVLYGLDGSARRLGPGDMPVWNVR